MVHLEGIDLVEGGKCSMQSRKVKNFGFVMFYNKTKFGK